MKDHAIYIPIASGVEVKAVFVTRVSNVNVLARGGSATPTNRKPQ